MNTPHFLPLYPLIAALLSMLTAQIIKIIYNLTKRQNLHLKEIFTSGGMPSSHSAMVSALTMAIAIQQGINTPEFSIAAIFSLVVLYDAAGVRRAVGNQAAVLNQIIDALVGKKPIPPKKLSELLGHTPLEVVMGVILGCLIAILLNPY